MELREYFVIIRKRWLLVASCLIACLGLAVGYTMLASPQYTAEAELVVSSQQSSSASSSDLLQSSTYLRNQVATYVQLVTQPLILDPVIKKLGLATTPEALAAKVSASNPVDTTIIDISVSDGNAAMAARIANAVADSMTSVIEEMETPQGSTLSRVKLTSASTATVPASPSSPKVTLTLALAAVAGLVIGIALALLREILDVRIKEPKSLAKLTDASVIGVVPETTAQDPDALILNATTASARAEAFRKLRTNLRFVDFENAPKSVVITSSIPGEAKTTTSINLAYAIAASGLRVCLVEADLRRPKLGQYLGLEDSVGLTSVLIGQVNLAGALQRFGGVPTLHVMTCGEVPPNPAEWLGSATMARLIQSLEQQYDMVIIDSPPLLPVTDAAVLSGMVGGTLLVVGSGKVNQAEVERSLQSLKTVDAKLLGIVMTFLKTRRMDAYGSTYSYTYESAGAAR